MEDVRVRAATLMKKCADAASSGRWVRLYETEGQVVTGLALDLDSEELDYDTVIDDAGIPDAEHIAGADPTVMLALAAWLQQNAVQHERQGDRFPWCSTCLDADGDALEWPCSDAESAIKTARAYLREEDEQR